MGEGRGGELGFLTTNERKDEMCLLLREAMKCSRISVHKQFVSISMGAEKGKNRLRDELANYCVINEQPKSAFGKLRKTFTGKLSGHQDDTAVALQIALLSSKIFYQVQTLHHHCMLFRCAHNYAFGCRRTATRRTDSKIGPATGTRGSASPEEIRRRACG
jgi:hypothetical protein